jgi:hypothetical protein
MFFIVGGFRAPAVDTERRFGAGKSVNHTLVTDYVNLPAGPAGSSLRRMIMSWLNFLALFRKIAISFFPD